MKHILRIIVIALFLGLVISGIYLFFPNFRAQAETISLSPMADAAVYESSSSTNFGTRTILEATTESPASSVSYLKFDLSTYAGRTITGAKIRLRTASNANSYTDGTVIFKSVSNTTWSETGITWNNRPSVSSITLGSMNPSSINTTYESTLSPTQLQSALGGQLTIAIANAIDDRVEFLSRETSSYPELIITFSAAAPTPTPIPPVNTPTPTTAPGAPTPTSPPPASVSWYNTSWQYRKAITIDKDQVAGPLSNFPVLISLTGDAALAAKAQSDGDDILFTLADGTKLSHEIESYSSGKLVVWVKVPTLSSTTDTQLYMYYGNPSAANQQNAANVWDGNFKAVWHSDDTSGTTVIDSSSNNNHGTKKTTTQPAVLATGKINGALDYVKSTTDYVNVSAATNDFQTGSASYTFWFKPESTFNSGSPTEEFLVALSDTVSVNDLQAGLDDADGTFQFIMWNNSGTIQVARTAQNSWTGGTWYHAAVVYDSTSGMKIYINGSPDGTRTFTSRGTSANATEMYLGRRYDGNNYFDGALDEIRVSNTARSAAWIKTEYNNQNAPSTFYTVGTEDTSTSAGNPSPTSAPPSSGVTLDSQTNGNGSTSWSHTTSNFPNRVLLVSVRSTGSLPSFVRYNNVNLSLLRSAQPQSTGAGTDPQNYPVTSVWYMINPPVGTYTVSVNGAVEGGSASFYNVNTASPFGTPGVSFADRTNINLASYIVSSGIPTTSPGQLVFSAFSIRTRSGSFASIVPASGQAGLYNSDISQFHAASTKPASNGTNTPMGWIMTTPNGTFDWSGVAIGINPAPLIITPSPTPGGPTLTPTPLPAGFIGNVINVNFGVSAFNSWIQATCGSVRLDNGIQNPIPATAVGGAYMLQTGPSCTTPSVLYGGAGSVSLGTGQASSTDWIVGGTTYPEVYSGSRLATSYTTMVNKVQRGQVTTTNLSNICTLSNCTLPAGLPSGIYTSAGNVNLRSFTTAANRDYIFLINGNLTMQGAFIIPQGSNSTALFSASGNIIVEPTVGNPANSTLTSLDGWYSADDSFIVNSFNDCTDVRLNVGGAIITNAARGGGTFQNNRDLCTDDASYPAVTITQRLDMVLNAPEFLSQQTLISHEVAP